MRKRRSFTEEDKKRILSEAEALGVAKAAKAAQVAYSLVYRWKKEAKEAKEESAAPAGMPKPAARRAMRGRKEEPATGDEKLHTVALIDRVATLEAQLGALKAMIVG